MVAEQQLINAFMKLTAKVGAGALIKELVRAVDENGNPKSWTSDEIQHAISFINDKVDTFDKREAIEIVLTLIHKFNIHPQDLHISDVSAIETHSTPGLQ